MTQGKVAMVDDDDYDWLVGLGSWYADLNRNRYYARCRIDTPTGGTGMHRLIMGVTDPKIKVDHRDLDGLNNRRSNLRIATNSQNGQNTGLTTRNQSGHKGVCWNKKNSKWVATISVGGRNVYLGLFVDLADAVAAYAAAAEEHHGEFARIK